MEGRQSARAVRRDILFVRITLVVHALLAIVVFGVLLALGASLAGRPFCPGVSGGTCAPPNVSGVVVVLVDPQVREACGA